jgi:glutaredoxin
MFDTVRYASSGGDSDSTTESRVYLYGLSFCEHCTQGRALLEELGIDFSMTYLDKLEPGVRRPILKHFRDLYGKPVVYPVLEIDGEFTFGYNREVWSDLLRPISQET